MFVLVSERFVLYSRLKNPLPENESLGQKVISYFRNVEKHKWNEGGEKRGGTPQYRRTKLLKLDRQMTSETAEQVNTVD